jgi:translation initiation factor 2D
MPIKVMDEYIREAFLNAVKVGLNDKDLPMDANVFYS